MKIPKKVGFDIGNDALKIALLLQEGEEKEESSKGEEVKPKIKTVEIMNIVSPGYERRIMEKDKAKLENLLDVTIIENEKEARYFIGGLAYKEAKGDIIEKTKLDTKAENDDTVILIQAGLAYALYDPRNPKKDEVVCLGSLLPIEEYFDDKLLDKFTKKLINRSFTVRFNSSAFNGAEISITILDNIVSPEGVAATLYYLFDTNGDMKPEVEKNIENETIVTVDIGSITTELSVFENGDFNSKGFRGIDIGTSYALDNIADDLDEKCNVQISRHKVDSIIRNNKGLRINATTDYTKKLNEFTQVRYDYFGKLIINRINKKLSASGINLSLASKLNMVGGGSISLVDVFKKEYGDKVKLAENPRFANAIGALISVIVSEKEASEEVME